MRPHPSQVGAQTGAAGQLPEGRAGQTSDRSPTGATVFEGLALTEGWPPRVEPSSEVLPSPQGHLHPPKLQAVWVLLKEWWCDCPATLTCGDRAATLGARLFREGLAESSMEGPGLPHGPGPHAGRDTHGSGVCLVPRGSVFAWWEMAPPAPRGGRLSLAAVALRPTGWEEGRTLPGET